MFGHEVGHIAHRHLMYFGFFIVGSLLVLFLAGSNRWSRWWRARAGLAAWLTGDSTASLVVRALATLGGVGLYFLAVFGFVSRRFERQADVFGCRVVSCGRPECPPHADLDGPRGAGPQSVRAVAVVGAALPGGRPDFRRALTNVAMLNGMRPNAWSWRHGSIHRRVTFLEGLVGEPEAERTFQRRVVRMRRGMAALLLSVVVALVWATGFGA